MSKRFVDYYLDAVTKKEGSGGGGSTLINKNISSNGTYNASSDNADGYKKVVVNVPGSIVDVSPKDVNFIDYDGTVIYAYTKDQFLQLTEMPENPSHEGLTAQGWNWELADAKEYVTKYGGQVIGQNYVTSDGATRIYIDLEDENLLADAGVFLEVNPSGSSFTIDWGDGTIDSLASSASAERYSHSYNATGQYVISISTSDDSVKVNLCSTKPAVSAANAMYQSSIFAKSHSATDADVRLNQAYLNCVRRIEIGSNVGIDGNSPFGQCTNLESITMPKDFRLSTSRAFSFYKCSQLRAVVLGSGEAYVDGRWFVGCVSLRYVSAPKSATHMPVYTSNPTAYLFSGDTSLKEFWIPEGIVAIGNHVFNGTQIRHAVIPDTVTSIGTSVFANDYCLTEIHLKSTTPPTLGTNVFAIPNGRPLKIFVPSGSLADYQAATNWSTYAAYMVEE